ncbi:hypothetical protein [Bosea sp. 2RAB26]|uniref:hypothetical protein n=1 Tax=Bosea sp. 2RAB26 TaxID=3237476 RepID=UPI003F93EBA9
MGQSSMALAGAGLSIAGGVSEGIAKKTGSQIQAAKLKQAADAGRVRAVQTDAAFREELADVQSTMSAIRSSQGVQFDSPTSFALFDAAEEKSRRARMIAVSNERMKALGLEGDAAATLLAARNARATAMLKSAPDILSGLGKASSIGSDLKSAYAWLAG